MSARDQGHLSIEAIRGEDGRHCHTGTVHEHEVGGRSLACGAAGRVARCFVVDVCSRARALDHYEYRIHTARYIDTSVHVYDISEFMHACLPAAPARAGWHRRVGADTTDVVQTLAPFCRGMPWVADYAVLLLAALHIASGATLQDAAEPWSEVDGCATPQRDTDFIGDNKLHFVASNWSTCCEKCSSIEPCHFWTFEGTVTKAGACFLKATSTTPAGNPHPGRVSGSMGPHGGSPTWPRPPTPPPTPPYSPAGPFRCESELDCSLNGHCSGTLDPATNSTCLCLVGWRGKRCETLDLLPASPQAGYQHREGGANISSWGMPMLRHPTTGVYHAWPAEMTSHCKHPTTHQVCIRI